MKHLAACLLLLLAANSFGQSHEINIELAGGGSAVLPLADIQRIVFTDIDTAVDEQPALTRQFRLLPSHPNPFNPSTTIEYVLSSAARVRVQVLDLRGALVRELLDEQQAAGQQQLLWDGLNHAGLAVASGVYLLHVRQGEESQVGKLILVK